MTREHIVARAVAMIDEHGYPAFSVRRLATELDITPSTVIHHVGQRTELLNAVVDAILLPPLSRSVGSEEQAGQDWRAEVRLAACSLREVFLRHPRAMPLVLELDQHVPAAAEGAARMLTALYRGGVPVERLLGTRRAIVGFVAGYALHENAAGPKASDAVRDARRHASEFNDQVLAGEFRQLLDMVEDVEGREPSGIASDRGFDRGLDALIVGLEERTKGCT